MKWNCNINAQKFLFLNGKMIQDTTRKKKFYQNSAKSTMDKFYKSEKLLSWSLSYAPILIYEATVKNFIWNS